MSPPADQINLLALECATGPCSVAVLRGGRLAAHLREEKPLSQAARIIPMAEAALKESGLAYRDLHAVAATTGPGSFTGIRVGLAAARGIAFAASIPGIGVSTLAALAQAATDAQKKALPILIAMRAGRGEICLQAFEVTKEKGVFASHAPMICAIDDLARHLPTTSHILAGNAQEELARLTDAFLPLPGIVTPDAQHVAILAARLLARDMEAPLRPFYLRPPDATLPASA